MACQVSGAVVSAVSAMTVQLGRKIAPVIVEKGGKVSYLLPVFFTKYASEFYLVAQLSKRQKLDLSQDLVAYEFQ